MPASQPANDFRVFKYPTALFLVMVAAGLAGNYFKFQILNLDLIFGSIFAMLVLQVFGLSRGILAAAIISSYTYLIWNHPYAFVTMTAEVAIVGWLNRHYNVSLLMADTLYWLFVGIPIGFCCFVFISHLSISNALFLMTKQTVNGIANVLIARFIFTGYALITKSSLIPFREIISNLLAFFVLCSTLTVLVIDSRTDFAKIDKSIQTSLLWDCRQVCEIFEQWIENRKNSAVNLAGLAALLSPGQMQARLEQARFADINFLRMVLINKEGISTAYSPPVDELGRSNIGKNFADRPYIPALKQMLKPMLSEVMTSRFGAPDPVVIMLAPVINNGIYDGAIGGILDFDRIQSFLEASVRGQNLFYVLLDKNDNVILTNHKSQKIMAPYSRGKGKLISHQEGISQWIPELPLNISTIEHWGRSRYVADASIGSVAEWKLILEQPVLPFQKILYDRYTAKLTFLLFVLLASLAIAELSSRGIVRTNIKLGQITRDLPRKLSSGGTVNWPESAITDSHYLIANFREMSESLKGQFDNIRQINESLEQKIEMRICDLRASENRYRSLISQMTVGFALHEIINDQNEIPINYRFLEVNNAFETITGLNAKQIAGKTALEVIPNLSSALIQRYGKTANSGESDQFETFFEQFNKHLQILVYSPQKSQFVTIFNDITGRKQAEALLQEKEELLRNTGRIAKIGGWEFDPITLKGTWTDEVAKIHDLDPDQEIDATIGLSFYQGIHRQKIERAVREAIEFGKPYNLVLEMVTTKGNRKWVRTIGHPIKEGNKVIRIRGSFQDITKGKRAEEEISRSRKELVKLSSHLLTTREQERTGIARNIHDELGQLLTAVRMDIQWVRKKMMPEMTEVDQKFAVIIDLIDKASKTIRRICSELRPGLLDEFGLAAAIEWHAKDFQKRTGISCNLILPSEGVSFKEEIAISLFRIFQEALTNAARHSNATHMEIALQQCNGNVMLAIEDNGKGLVLEKVSNIESFGILGMKERANLLGGTLTIAPPIKGGTRIEVVVPLERKGELI